MRGMGRRFRTDVLQVIVIERAKEVALKKVDMCYYHLASKVTGPSPNIRVTSQDAGALLVRNLPINLVSINDLQSSLPDQLLLRSHADTTKSAKAATQNPVKPPSKTPTGLFSDYQE